MPAARSEPQRDEPHYTTVYANGKDGYPQVRIPSLIATSGGTVLAFCEGRQELGDHSQNDFILKRSTDNGQTWSDSECIVTDGTNTVTDPAAVIDQRNGRIILHYTRFADGYHTDKAPPGYDDPHSSRNYVICSDDDAQTWSDPVDITRDVKRPDVIAAVVTCGIGVQIRRGPFANRLVFGVYHSSPDPGPATYAVYSDDGGATWARGDLALFDDEDRTGEPQVVELADGSVMMNARTKTKCRRVGISKDGGATFSELVHDPVLIDPGCQGSILRYSDPLDGKPSRILFCNAAAGKDDRVNGTVRLSYDEGKMWPISKVIYKDQFAYSCMAVLPDGRIGCAFEKDAYRDITLARFSLGWLTDGEDEG